MKSARITGRLVNLRAVRTIVNYDSTAEIDNANELLKELERAAFSARGDEFARFVAEAVLTLGLYGHLRVKGVRCPHALPPAEAVASRAHVLSDRAGQVAQAPRLAPPLEPHEVAVEAPRRDPAEPREEGLEGGVHRVDQVERRRRAAGGEAQVRGGAHLAQRAQPFCRSVETTAPSTAQPAIARRASPTPSLLFCFNLM